MYTHNVPMKEATTQEKTRGYRFNPLEKIQIYNKLTLDVLESLKGVRFPRGNVEDEDYTLVFDQTAREVYEVITGRSYPRSSKVV